jgi:hypothetical protein
VLRRSGALIEALVHRDMSRLIKLAARVEDIQDTLLSRYTILSQPVMILCFPFGTQAFLLLSDVISETVNDGRDRPRAMVAEFG